MSLPPPKAGLVIRYSYLWASDAARGLDEGSKERPAVIVVCINLQGSAEPSVVVLPITHSPPSAAHQAIEMPADVARKAGLDAARTWVVLSEFNEFVWPGFDLRHVPGRDSATVAYGFVTSGFFGILRDRWLALDRAGKSQSISRNE
jgi:hypothetical protein